MENKGLLAGFVGVVIIALAAILLVSKQVAPSVTVTVPGGSAQPVVVQSPAGQSSPVIVQSGSGREEQRFGGTTNLDSLSLGGTLTVTGSSTFPDITLGGGNFAALAGAASSTMSSSATTTACAIYNGEGRTRMITDMGVLDVGSAVSLGAVAWVAGTSTVPSGSAVSLNLVNTTITRLSGQGVPVATSTPKLTANAPWATGTYLKFVSATTTNVGKCWAMYQ